MKKCTCNQMRSVLHCKQVIRAVSQSNHQLHLSAYSVLKVTLRGRNGILMCSYRIVVVSTRVIPLLIGNQKRQFPMVLGTLAMLVF